MSCPSFTRPTNCVGDLKKEREQDRFLTQLCRILFLSSSSSSSLFSTTDKNFQSWLASYTEKIE